MRYLSVLSPGKAWVSDCITSHARLGENPIKPFRITRELIFRLVGSAESSEDIFAFALAAKCEIRAPHTRLQPVCTHDDTPASNVIRVHGKWRVRPTCLAPFHAVAGRHEQIRGPGNLLAQSV